MTLLTILSTLFLLNILTLLIMGFLTVTFLVTFLKVPESRNKKSDLPFVSVVVPARNEESKLGRCLESLVKQDYPHFEIVVIDDRSTDQTTSIIADYEARYPFVKGLRGTEAPKGWSGKNNALAQAVRYANGDWYLFTDADTSHKPQSIEKAVGFALQHNSDLVSFMPVQELGSFWERVIMPVLLGSFLIGDPLNSINDQKDKRAYAYGQYILVRSAAYDAVGGHGSVKNQILEDIVFARVMKQAGFRVHCGDGRPLYQVRMYNDFESIWHGWTKNAYSIVGCNVSYLFLAVLAINVTILMPFLHVLGAAISRKFLPPAYSEWFIAGATIEIVALALWFKASSIYYKGISWYHFFLLPLGSLTVSAIYLTSAYLILTKSQVQWKGRTYNVNPNNAIDHPETLQSVAQE